MTEHRTAAWIHERIVVLNELAQGLRPMADGLDWFAALDDSGQRDALQFLAMFCVQARATTDDGPECIRRAGIRPTHTPAVLVARGRIEQQLEKIVRLPQDERAKSFKLLVALLAVADERRRARFCADGCTHAWHHLGAPAGQA